MLNNSLNKEDQKGYVVFLGLIEIICLAVVCAIFSLSALMILNQFGLFDFYSYAVQVENFWNNIDVTLMEIGHIYYAFFGGIIIAMIGGLFLYVLLCITEELVNEYRRYKHYEDDN